MWDARIAAGEIAAPRRAGAVTAMTAAAAA
jgi:hypothetical protein